MDAKHLIAVERWTLALAAVVIGAAILALDRRTAFGASLGAGLMALNAYALRRIGQRGFKGFRKPQGALLLFNIKMVALIALVYVAIRWLHVAPVPFVVGISIFPVAIVIVAIRHQVSQPTEDSETHG